MTSKQECPRCGKELPADAPEGVCPACLAAAYMKTGLARSEQVEPMPVAEVAGLFPELEILELLGAGGMGAVYKARQPKLGRLVALKILDRHDGDSRFVERFTREAQTLARLSHPNIVTVHEFGEREGLPFLIMELVDGVTLRSLLRAGKMPPEQALAIVPPICEALQYAHDKGVIHRDIKPENILVDKEGRVKVADFGIARLMEGDGTREHLTGDAERVGTAHYMAPEQVERPAEVDHRADIYALGVVFYEMLTGELPLGKFPQPSKRVEVDVRLDEVVLKALEKEPEQRYQQASEVKTAVTTVSTITVSGNRVGSAPQHNPWETISVGIGTLFFLVFITGVLEASRVGDAPLTGTLLVIAGTGLLICVLSVAGYWPFPSPWFPEPNFSSRNLRRNRNGSGEIGDRGPRVSRLAIAGVAWAALFWIAFIPMFFLRQVSAEGAASGPGWFLLLIIPLVVLGMTAPFGTTVLGWVAMGRIRRSEGRIYGFGLAFFDGVFFPVLILIGLIYWFCWWLFHDVIRAAVVAYMADQKVEAGELIMVVLRNTGGFAVVATAILAALILIPLLRAIWGNVTRDEDGRKKMDKDVTSGSAPAERIVT